jgi:hypothetical protein
LPLADEPKTHPLTATGHGHRTQATRPRRLREAVHHVCYDSGSEPTLTSSKCPVRPRRRRYEAGQKLADEPPALRLSRDKSVLRLYAIPYDDPRYVAAPAGCSPGGRC